MSQMKPVAQLAAVSHEELLFQARLRRDVLVRLMVSARAATSPEHLVVALHGHADALRACGLFDEAARLFAYARAVGADASRLADEATALEARLLLDEAVPVVDEAGSGSPLSRVDVSGLPAGTTPAVAK